MEIHKGIARTISTRCIQIMSDHNICQHKKIAMQLMIPSLKKGAPQKIIKAIGKSVVTIMQEGKFMTEIEILHFEEDGMKELHKKLHLCLGDPSFAHTTQLS